MNSKLHLWNISVENPEYILAIVLEFKQNRKENQNLSILNKCSKK